MLKHFLKNKYVAVRNANDRDICIAKYEDSVAFF